MTRSQAPIISFASTALLFALATACGGDPARDGSPTGETFDAGPQGAAKGEACVETTDCADPAAVCRQGGLCTGPIDEVAFQLECVRDAPEVCPGLVCVGLVDNQEAKTGICSLPCDEDAECGAGAACVALTASRSFCLHVCTTDGDCANGFSCVEDPGGRGHACLVNPV